MNTYFDLTYITPTGYKGTHVAVEAESQEVAARKSKYFLAVNTCWKPEEFQIIDIIQTPENNTPKQIDQNSEI